MASINFTGLASGIDTKALVDAILSSERRPLTRIEEKRALFSQKKAALDELSAKLSSFQSALQELATDRTFRARVATVADETVLRATAGTAAETGLFDVVVGSLASASKIKSEGLSASDEALVTDGTITIQSGTGDPIVIDVSAGSGNNTLEAVRSAINDADAGVSAAILFDGTDYRLTVRAEETGVDNALVITDDTNLDLDLAGNVVNAAADAELTIDGIDITSSSNQVVNAIPGVTLDLLGTTAVDDSVSVEIGQDFESVTTAIQSLVDGYNELVDFFNAQDNPDAPGVLYGDPTARRAEQRIRSLFSGGVDGIPFGEIRALSSLGVDFDGKTGRANLDTSELNDVLESNFDQVGNLFLPSESSDGFVQTLVDASKLYTRLGDGLLESAADNLATQIERLGDDIERIEARLSRREIQLINQFGAAENAISALNAQQSTLGSFRIF